MPQPTTPSTPPADAPPPGYFGPAAVAGGPPAAKESPSAARAAAHRVCPSCGEAIPGESRYAAKSPGMAIWSLVFGIAGFLFVPACLALGLGFGALGIIKHTGQKGRGLAISGIALSGFWLALWAVILILP